MVLADATGDAECVIWDGAEFSHKVGRINSRLYQLSK
jgi:hypothetical protein|tara:strand:- start:528 stop:638 length:111 start_codon:yes stop_codon:yes gene_type:complete